MRHRLPSALPVAAAVLLATACGSTAATTANGGGVQGGVQAGLSAPSSTTTGGSGLGGTTGSVPGSGGSGTAGTTGGGGGSGVTGGTGVGGTAGTAGANGGPTTGGSTSSFTAAPGITPSKVYLGIPYFPDASQTNAAIGAGGANSGDQRDYYNAVIADVNKRGGIRGRKVAPIYFQYSSTSGEPQDSQDQRACDMWTKDNKVFAIFMRGGILQECARKAGILILAGGGETGPVFDRLPNLVSPAAVRLERLAESTVTGLARQKYFQPTTEWPTGKVGLISWDDASYRYGVSHGYVPALKKLGLTAQTSFVAEAQTAGSIADAGSAVSSAVLSFKAAGIDHVFIQDGPAGLFGGAGLTLLFLNNAKGQHYFPRYGFNANNVPGYSVFPADEEHGMLAVDFSDFIPTQDDGMKPNATRQRCFGIMQKYGVTVKDTNTYGTAAAACDEVWFIQTLLERAAQPTLQGALEAVNGLGTSYPSPLVYGTRLGVGRHDGGAMARNSRFDDACTCMRFTSMPYEP